MSYATLILGESGTGKTCSLRNFDPSKTLLIQPVRKPLPFPAKNWRTGKGGNIAVTSSAKRIIEIMQAAPHEIIVIDDFQYVMSFKFMAKRNERGYDKFTEIGGDGFDIVKAASELALDKRVYILSHTETYEDGRIKIKTIGKMLDEKIVLEGLFTTVLRTIVDAGRYYFSTHNDGRDTVKSPLGMFESDRIDNDLAAVDARICEYYGINTNHETSKENE